MWRRRRRSPPSPGKKPWEVKVDIAMPCATQNELDGEDARKLLAIDARSSSI